MVTQKRTELEAKRQLILNGTLPRLQLVDLETQLRSAEAGLAGAEAERDRGVVRAPWSGVVHEVGVEVGQAAFSMVGRELVTIVALDPMLAVVGVAAQRRRQVGHSQYGVTGETAAGKAFVKTASQTTRANRVEIQAAERRRYPDGITAEVSMPQSPVPATRVPRSALTFPRAASWGCARSTPTASSATYRSVVEDRQTTCGSAALPTQPRDRHQDCARRPEGRAGAGGRADRDGEVGL
jgi:multidrug efflux system membrane fusion protein